jgi:hypothetical protein
MKVVVLVMKVVTVLTGRESQGRFRNFLAFEPDHRRATVRAVTTSRATV